MEDIDGSIVEDDDIPRWIMDYYNKLTVKGKKKLKERLRKKEEKL